MMNKVQEDSVTLILTPQQVESLKLALIDSIALNVLGKRLAPPPKSVGKKMINKVQEDSVILILTPQQAESVALALRDAIEQDDSEGIYAPKTRDAMEQILEQFKGL